jgi:hypothetical protein
VGLFDFFMSEEKQIARHARRLTNRDSQPEDREASARWLAENGKPESILALLSRFDMNLEHQMKDQTEKELVYDLLLGKKDAASGPARSWLRQCKQFAMPLKLLGELEGREAAVKMAFELLEIERKKDDFKPEKKKGILVWLADVRHPGVIEAASAFLDDFDEGVRYSAVEAIAAQGSDAGREPLTRALTTPRDESNRLRVRLAEIFVQRGWRVDESAAERLPEGFRIRDGRVVR